MFMYFFLSIISWLFGCSFLFYQDFSLISFWCCLIFMSVSLLPFSFINFSQNSLFPFFKYLLFQEVFSLFLLFSWFFSFFSQMFVLVFCFFKLGIAPLAFWLEKIILEMKEGVFWLLTLPKIGPSVLMFSFSTYTSLLIMFLSVFFAFSKLFSVKNFLIIILYLGNFSTFFGFYLSILFFFKSIMWFMLYLVTNFVILLFLENQKPDIFFFLFFSPLPPMPFFFLKLYLFCFFSSFSVFFLLFILLFSIIIFYCIWEISSTFLYFNSEFFFTKKLYFLYCSLFCLLILFNFLLF